ncbi:hypothetical protein CJD36_009535 [Flavipsychrobacter stenotrophus]|uniref:DUF349 domain-containing protein n=1 Tax=Flavipsychrobacter stenotrophus TaxID=2077091 RepID=A0A2S7SYJ8_9BACT|nr:DUF349 domain-containing protein [Flavipsychrobacter stenotrophus]PQJ12020.1 hypothetical protein CJD36_009535 [Flavipsychrobacter stenotrophus]
MAPENVNIISWWEEQSFPGKDLFKLDEDGTVTLTPTALVKEREIAVVTIDNAETVLKNLQEKFEEMQSRVREAEIEWMAATDKSKMADKIEQLKGLINSTVAIGDFEKAAQLVNDWESSIKKASDENVAAKKALAELAESLADSTEYKETSQAFKDITEKWRLSGFLDKSRNDMLWKRIENARKKFQDRKRDFHDEEEKDLLVTLDLKIEIAELAESLQNSEEWKSATEAYHELTERWKSTGRTIHKRNEELWQRIMTAKNIFFDRKKAHFAQIQVEQEANLIIKLELAEKAEALANSTDWSATATAMGALKEQWRNTGRVPHEKADELNKRFNDSVETFFDARRKHTEAIRVTQEQNYALKSELLQRAEEIKDSNRWGETTVEMNRLFDEWKTIGPVPREHNTTIWDAFMGARKHFFQRKDADRDQRKQQFDAQKAAREEQDIAYKKEREAQEIASRKTRIEQAHKTIEAAHTEIKEEEEKLADFKNAIENITPGKKAEELRTHLAALIEESTKHLDRLKKKVVTVTEDMNKIIEKEQQKEKEEANAEQAAS